MHMLSLTEDEVHLNGRNQYFFGITDVLFFPKFIAFCGFSKLLPQLNPFSFGFHEISTEHNLALSRAFTPLIPVA